MDLQTATPAQLAAAAGYEPEAPGWRTTSDPAVPMSRFGKDHWSTFAYIETRDVDHKGTINHDHMRCHSTRHPFMHQAKASVRSGLRFGGSSGSHPTILKSALPLGQVTGERQRVELADHDDYDCLDDLRAAGLLDVRMPRTSKSGQSFMDANGKRIRDLGGGPIDPGFVTGMTELQLCAYATWHLTERGRVVASQLRAHKANGGNFATFEPEV